MSSEGNDALQKYLAQTGRNSPTSAQAVTSQASASTVHEQHVTSSVPVSTKPSVSNSKIRSNPRTGSPLYRKVIPGTAIEIDYDPVTGGVFLDSGELEALSKVPDIKAKLEMLLTP